MEEKKKISKKWIILIIIVAVIGASFIIIPLITSYNLVTDVFSESKVQAAKASANNVISALNQNEQIVSFAPGAIEVVRSNVIKTNNITADSSSLSENSSGSGTYGAIIITDGDFGTAKITGTYPTRVVLKVNSNNVITDGCMIIDGYDVTIKDGYAFSVKAASKNSSTCTFPE